MNHVAGILDAFGHAYHTYDEYLKTYEAQLKAQPAPQVAINFYRDGDLYIAVLRKMRYVVGLQPS
ncbi:hypothetical protein QUA56_20685 [Microcoleus sp. N3A4]|uniref:hypothetical protein n=1 Tax=Microcoleus sp. N3A4 TaxID=3055379 RepID=UPI002FD29D38